MKRMSHPDLPGQEITVSSRSAAVHRASGWQDVEDKQHDDDPAVDVAAAKPTRAKRDPSAAAKPTRAKRDPSAAAKPTRAKRDPSADGVDSTENGA